MDLSVFLILPLSINCSYICGIRIFWFKNGQYSDKFVIILYNLIINISYFINAVRLHGEKQQKWTPLRNLATIYRQWQAIRYEKQYQSSIFWCINVNDSLSLSDTRSNRYFRSTFLVNNISVGQKELEVSGKLFSGLAQVQLKIWIRFKTYVDNTGKSILLMLIR